MVLREVDIPEGPEVEVVFRQLQPLLERATIVDSRSYHQRFPILPCGKIAKMFRHGKWIHVLFDSGVVVRINLGMSGRFVLGESKQKHVRWAALIDTGQRKRLLRYVDPRGFGHLEIYKGLPAKHLANPRVLVDGSPIAGLGPDLMSRFMHEGDASRRLAVWRKALDTPAPIKTALMDQSRLAGLGNIYASELCYLAGVSPNRPANKLNRIELLRMIDGCTLMLDIAVRFGGTSFGDANTFRDLHGAEGTYRQRLMVYGKDKSKCRCGGTIVKTKMQGRSTFHCSKCQGN